MFFRKPLMALLAVAFLCSCSSLETGTPAPNYPGGQVLEINEPELQSNAIPREDIECADLATWGTPVTGMPSDPVQREMLAFLQSQQRKAYFQLIYPSAAERTAQALLDGEMRETIRQDCLKQESATLYGWGYISTLEGTLPQAEAMVFWQDKETIDFSHGIQSFSVRANDTTPKISIDKNFFGLFPWECSMRLDAVGGDLLVTAYNGSPDVTSPNQWTTSVAEADMLDTQISVGLVTNMSSLFPGEEWSN